MQAEKGEDGGFGGKLHGYLRTPGMREKNNQKISMCGSLILLKEK